jgi:formate/nitrite transporter FocA (FNT family)
MSGRDPDEIWRESLDEGQRRLSRGSLGLAATGLVGGVDVMAGILALMVLTGALTAALGTELAHVVGSLAFGIGFVLLIVGRSELFTENFLVPVNAVLARRARLRELGRLWGLTFLGNLAGLALFAFALSRTGVLQPSALEAAGQTATTFAERGVVAALLSAVMAGTVMTLLTWVTHAVERDTARILIALLVGFLLSAPNLNHAVVGFGEMAFGILAATTGASWGEVAGNVALATVGNLAGGLFFVTATRLLQARGEPDSQARLTPMRSSRPSMVAEKPSA